MLVDEIQEYADDSPRSKDEKMVQEITISQPTHC
jgi:hypothetical protein